MTPRTVLSMPVLLMVALAALLPVVVIPAAWLGVEHAKMMVAILAVVIGAVAWGVTILKRGEIEMPRTWFFLGIALLPLAYLVSAIVAQPTIAAFFGSGLERDTVVSIVLWCSIALIAAVALTTRRALTSVHFAIIGATLVAIVVQCVRIFVWPQFLMGASGAASATLAGSWHDLILLAGLATLLSAGYLGSSAIGSRARIVLGVTILASIVMMIMASFRDIWIVLAAVSIGVLLLSLRAGRSPAAQHVQPPQPAPTRYGDHYNYTQENYTEPTPQRSTLSEIFQPRQRRWALIVVAVVSLSFAAFGSVIHDRLPTSMRIVQFEVRPSWEGTFAVVTSVWSEGKVALGSGPNTFANDWVRYKPIEVNETPFWEVGFRQGVGFIPTSLATVGVLGALAWAVFLFMIIALSWKVIRTAPAEHVVTSVVSVGAVVYVWAVNIMYVPGIGVIALSFLLAGTLVGLLVASGAISTKAWSLSGNGMRSMATSVVAVVVFIVMFGASAGASRAALADAILNNGIVNYQTTGDLGAAGLRVQRALDLYPSDRAHRAAVELGLLQLQQAIASGDVSETSIAQIQAVLEVTIQHGLTAVVENEGDLQNWLVLARTYEELAGVQVPGAFENAQATYEQARDAHPTSPIPYFKLAQLAAAQNDMVGAQAMLDEALMRKQSYLPAHLLRSRIYTAQGDVEAALASMQSVVQLAPNEPGAWYEFGVLLLSAGDLQNAEIALAQAITIQPEYANAWFMLARIYFEAGDNERALAALERVRALNPDNQAVLEAIQQVQSGANTAPAELNEESSTLDTAAEVVEE